MGQIHNFKKIEKQLITFFLLFSSSSTSLPVLLPLLLLLFVSSITIANHHKGWWSLPFLFFFYTFSFTSTHINSHNRTTLLSFLHLPVSCSFLSLYSQTFFWFHFQNNSVRLANFSPIYIKTITTRPISAELLWIISNITKSAIRKSVSYWSPLFRLCLDQVIADSTEMGTMVRHGVLSQLGQG